MFLKLGAGIRATHRETAKYQQGPRNWQGAQLFLVGQVWGAVGTGHSLWALSPLP